jgi:crotonobetainyl-CoA:carnitine CoA-transferase CaiB-like acyl-CoA transferase
MRIEMPHPQAASGTVPLIASPIKMSATPPSYRHAPPTLGQHTDEVLEELLGLDAGERGRLREQGIIG